MPNTPAEIVRCILDSLSDAYADALVSLERISGVPISSLHIVGGGSQNDLLSQLTADRCGIEVWAGPVEATALGNLLSQADAHSAAPKGLDSQRKLIGECFSAKLFTPRFVGAK